MSAELSAIFIGGGLGAVLRFLLARTVQIQLNSQFPFGILIVNILGSALMGLLWVLLFERFDIGALWRSALLIGLLGGFTTFSSFSIDSVNMLIKGEIMSSTLYILASVILCLLGTWLGILLGRSW